MKKIFSKNSVKFILSILLILIIQLISSLFTGKNFNWYSTLVKPPLTPPNYVFGPVWSILYLMIAISFYFVWINKKKKKKKAFIFFFLQLFFNSIWTFCFFYLENPLLGLIDILFLDVFIILTIIEFYKISKFSAIMLIPYVIWTLFATYLNIGFLVLN